MNTYNFKVLDNEYWWCGVVDLSSIMPFDKNTNVSYDLCFMPTCNQVNPVFISSAGRWAWMEDLGVFTFKDGELILTSDGEIAHGQEENLRSAYLKVSKEFFPSDGNIPDETSFVNPQYSTWMQFFYEQSQKNILSYAEYIKENDLPTGELILDDGWEEYYGYWDFNLRKFPNPKHMCDRLHELGFKVVLWIVPYVSADSDVYRLLKSKDLLVKDNNGKIFIAEWWNGYSAMLDFSNPNAVQWFEEQETYLKKAYGIDGLKMDGGDARFAPQFRSGYNNVMPHEHSRLYASLCSNLKLKELRACVKEAGKAIIQRVADKEHSWKRLNGIAGIIEKVILQGLSGYAYTCPDMVGGGLIDDYTDGFKESEELYIRYMQLSALMPMFQFSKLFWKDNPKLERVVKKMIALHQEFAPYILEYAKNSAITGEPIVRSLAYQFNDAFTCNDEFMLGDDYLISPIITEGANSRTVYLPEGKWKYALTGEVFSGKKQITISPDLEDLPYFIRTKE